MVHDFRDRSLRRREQDFTNMNVIQQRTVLGNIDVVECLGILAVVPDMIKRLLNSPVTLHDHIVGRHETTDRIFWPVQERERNGTFLDAERVDQLRYDIAWEVLEQLGSVVRGHLIEQSTNFFPCHIVHELLLRVKVTVGKRLGSKMLWQEAKDNDATLFFETGNKLGKLDGIPFFAHLTDGRKVTCGHQLFDFRCKKMSYHAASYEGQPSLVAQGFDRIKICSAPRGVDAESEADHCTNHYAEDYGRRGEDVGKRRHVAHSEQLRHAP